MCEHFIFTFIPLKINLFILSHAGKSGDVLCLAQSLNQIVASSGSRSVCVVSPHLLMCHNCTFALPNGKPLQTFGVHDLLYPQGLNDLMLVPALLPQLGVKSPTNQLVAGNQCLKITNHNSRSAPLRMLAACRTPAQTRELDTRPMPEKM